MTLQPLTPQEKAVIFVIVAIGVLCVRKALAGV